MLTFAQAAAEAERQRKIREEEERKAAEAERQRKIREEEERKQKAAEAERQRKIREEEERKAAEAERQRKIREEEERKAAEAERIREEELKAAAKALDPKVLFPATALPRPNFIRFAGCCRRSRQRQKQHHQCSEKRRLVSCPGPRHRRPFLR
jgi:hypothetical protein